MDLAIDTNILLACFKPLSLTRRIISIDSLRFFTTEFQLLELEEYLEKMKHKYNLPPLMVKQTMDFLRTQITIVAKEEYVPFIPQLKQKIPNADDVPLLVLAFAKEITVWSNDPHFHQQKVVKTLTASQLLRLMRQGMV